MHPEKEGKVGTGWKLIHYSNALSGENELSAEMSSAKRFAKDGCLVFISKINTLHYIHLTIFFSFPRLLPLKNAFIPTLHFL